MKRALASALFLGVCSIFGLAGCGEENKNQESSTVSTPGGETTTTKETKVETEGSNPPPAPATPSETAK